MVTEQELIEFVNAAEYKPMSYQELEKHYGIDNSEDFKEFVKILNKLEEEGRLFRMGGDRYAPPEKLNLLRGKLQAHAKGFGFLLPEDKEHPDVYINANDMAGAMNGDIILVRITSKGAAGGRFEGEVVRIVTRATTQLVGTFQHNESYAFVLPDDKRMNRDIFIPKHAFNSAADGDKVVVKIVNYPDGRSAAEGEVIEILGHKDDPGVDILSVIRQFRLPEAFPDEVMAEAEAAPDTIREGELKGRRDLRDRTIVTIDGEDAKDLDDAVNVERLPNGHYLLGVHIADVSYYVRENSALDREAYERGTSVYLTDRVIPMLPHRLSNGICSLNPKVDRLTMSCEMEIDENGKVVTHDVFTSVIKTAERMTYANVRKILQNEDPEVTERYAYLADTFKLMEELAMMLRRNRMKRGAIDFDFPEAKILVDENGKPYGIDKRERSIAEMIIEEFMLKANETVAEHFSALKVPFLYRVHEDPDSEKLFRFMEFITGFGYAVKGGKDGRIPPSALQALLAQIKDTKEERVISTVLLRSMKQARYDAQPLGHFGLAAEYYSHFTSPIRRYPDLIIHRVIREVLENGGKLSDKRIEYLAGRMEDIAKQSSERERVAVEAERETDALKKSEYMKDKVGEEFEGIISGVTGFGLFVELDNTVEGLIRMIDLTDDFYNYHENQHALIGERTRKIFRLGDEVKVRVAKVNVDERTIDFEMVDMKPRSAGGFGGRGGGGGRDRDRGARGKQGRGGGKRGGAAAAGAGAGKRGAAKRAGGAGASASKGGGAEGTGPAAAASRALHSAKAKPGAGGRKGGAGGGAAGSAPRSAGVPSFGGFTGTGGGAGEGGAGGSAARKRRRNKKNKPTE